MKAKVHVTLKNGVLDPQGKAIETALDHLGFSGIGAVRVGKYIEVDLEGGDKAAARKTVEQMCEKLLANTVVEKFAVEVE
jgi:phosphoribosylformylglycinamidine synthase PurS subunit